MTVVPMKSPESEQKNKLKMIVVELLDRMVKALDEPKPDKGAKEQQGKEVASFSDLKEAVNTAAGVYRLFNATGDLDDAGSALESYAKDMKNGRTNSRR